jgi:hypothetical protein
MEKGDMEKGELGEQVIVSRKLLQAIADYLAGRPYREVAGFLMALVKETRRTEE